MGVTELSNADDCAQRMREMIRRLDVDVLELAYAKLGRIYTEARNTCVACESATECAHWLETLCDGAERPAFCPNLERFERFILQSVVGGLSPEAALAFLVSASTALPPELTQHADALAALGAALELREQGRRGVKITDTRTGETFSSAEFACAVGASSSLDEASEEQPLAKKL